MSHYYTPNQSAKSRVGADSGLQKDLAGDFLAENGYERQAKPREVNGGRDRIPQNYSQKKVRLNRDLALTPTPAQKSSIKRAGGASSEGKAIRKKKIKRSVGVSVTEVRSEKPATPFPLSLILCVMAITLVAIYVIHLYIELDELNATITEYNNQIAEMKNEERVLQSQRASKYNLEEIERIAKEKYGMVDKDQLPKEYITPESSDSIEVMKTSEVQETPDALLSGFAGAVSDILSYIN